MTDSASSKLWISKIPHGNPHEFDQWIGLREKIQEPPKYLFHGKINGFHGFR